MEEIRYFLLCGAEKEGTDIKGKTVKFMTYFGYRQQDTGDGTGTQLEDILTPVTDENGNPAMKAISIKVSLSPLFKLKLETCGLRLPVYISLKKERIQGKDGKLVNSYFVTPDLDKDTKKPRLDKYGKRHLVLVINDATILAEKQRDEYDLDDIESFE